MDSYEPSVELNGPIWISDIESKNHLQGRKLAGYWTLTIDAVMSNGDVFGLSSPIYDDTSFLSQLAFFRINTDCAALEWGTTSLSCRIWILIPEVTKVEIEKKLSLLSQVFSKFIDFNSARLSREGEPNTLNTVGMDANRLRELRKVVSVAERHWKGAIPQ